MKANHAIYVFLIISISALIPSISISASGSVSRASCGERAGSLVSIQGRVEKKNADSTTWQATDVNSVCCRGDSIRVLQNSRAALLLDNDTVIRLDQNTTMTLMPPQDARPFLIRLLEGVLYYFSIKPRSLELETPYINGAVEGTEFMASVVGEQSQIAVFEGRVLAQNSAGSVMITSGQKTIAEKNQTPISTPYVDGRDSLQWALYYPPLLDLQQYLLPRQQQSESRETIVKAVRFFFTNDLYSSLEVMEKPGDLYDDADFHKVRASLYLMVGRVQEAEKEVASLRTLDQGDSFAAAFQAVITMIKGDLKEAENLARMALTRDPASPAALVAMSYIEQASFKLDAALESIKKALERQPDNGLLLSRYAELIQATDNTSNRAVEAGELAVQKAPYLAHPHTVLGFTFLNRLEVELAAQSFHRAILIDQSAPLPRLGLGLVEIYNGHLDRGRDLLSIAAVLDPGNSLLRSYLGKVYYEERDFLQAAKQLQIAKDRDPNDPTPYYYSAILNSRENRPGKALLELKKSIELNDNRAIFRSRFMLDNDLAARSVDTGRVYSQLGFDQLALNYGLNSLMTAPSDYSSHRLLSDFYASMPRHEIARVSELLQSQLLQPLNIRPIQPQLAEADLQILDGSGPSMPSFDEYSSLFQRNKVDLLVSGAGGGKNTLGDDIVVSGVLDKFSYSLGQYYYTTDGFRENNDMEQKLYNGYFQYRLSPSTHFMTELRSNNKNYGDRSLLFDPTQFEEGLRQESDSDSWRIGGRHALAEGSEIIATIVGQKIDEKVNINDFLGSYSVDEGTDSINGEIQHLFSGNSLRSIIGGSYYEGDLLQTTTFDGLFLDVPEEVESDHKTFYGYTYLPIFPSVSLTAGLNYSRIYNGRSEQQVKETSPKLGLVCQFLPATSLRLTWMKTLTRSMISEQTIEPTQVAGFNQFYDDTPGTETEISGIGLDHEFSPTLYGGVSYIHRDLQVPYRLHFTFEESAAIKSAAWEERTSRAYLYWLPWESISLASEYLYEKFDRSPDFYGTEFIEELTTHRAKIQITWFHPSGMRTELSTTYVDQQGNFVDPDSFFYQAKENSDNFWVTDASFGYLLTNGNGLISLQVKNLFDTAYHFQDTDPARPTLSPGRLILLRFSYNF